MMFGKSNNLYFVNAYLGSTSITLIIDSVCRRKLSNHELYARDIRKIQDYYCCKHVAYGRFTCGHKIFFYNPLNPGVSAVHRHCPFRDGGRLYPNSIDELSS